MPKIMISVSERVTYSREVEMTDAQWLEWDTMTDQRGQAHDAAVGALTEKFIRRVEDWQGADRLQIEELSVVLEV